ncbi:MAG: response regulator [Chloroflexota bacterium]
MSIADPITAHQLTHRLLLVDDHELARHGLRSMLSTESDLEIVGEGGDGEEAIALSVLLDPDLVILDVRMPGRDGLSVARELRISRPNTNVIMFTMYESADYLVEAMKAGVNGFILKGASREDVLGTVHAVLRGETALPPALANQALQRMVSLETQRSEGSVIVLSDREREVLNLAARGFTNPMIAEALVVSVSTVKAHIQRVLEKLDVTDRTQAVVRAMELGLLKLSAEC